MFESKQRALCKRWNVCDDEEAGMPERNEFQTEEVCSNVETAGSKGCVDSRNRQQTGVGAAQRTYRDLVTGN